MTKRLILYSVLGLLTVWLFCPLKLGVVLGTSMQPSLKDHQVIVINRDYYQSHVPSVGDVVVLRHDDDVLVKRVAGVEGSRMWEMRDPEIGSYLLVRPHELWRLRRTLHRSPQLGSLREVDVRPGFVYVMGDAVQSSYDSRTFGPIPVSALQGRVVSAPRF